MRGGTDSVFPKARGPPLQCHKNCCVWAATALVLLFVSLKATAHGLPEASSEGGKTPDAASPTRPSKKWEAKPLVLPIITFRGSGPARPVTVYGYQGLPTGPPRRPLPPKGKLSMPSVLPPPKEARDEEPPLEEAAVPRRSPNVGPPSPPYEYPATGGGDRMTSPGPAEPAAVPEEVEEPRVERPPTPDSKPHVSPVTEENTLEPQGGLEPQPRPEEHPPTVEAQLVPGPSRVGPPRPTPREEYPPMVEAQVVPGPAKIGPSGPPPPKGSPPLAEGAGPADLSSARNLRQAGPVCKHSVSAFLQDHNDALHRALHVVDQITTGSDCVALAMGTKFLDAFNHFPHEVNRVREAALLSGITRSFFGNLQASLIEIEQKKAAAEHTGEAVAKARSLLNAAFRVGDRVKEIDNANGIRSSLYIVSAVRGDEVICETGPGGTRKLRADRLIKSEDPAAAGVADLSLRGEWSMLQKTNPALFKAMVATVEARGWGRAYEEANKSENWKILLHQMERADSTGLLALADASRMVLNAGVLHLDPTDKRVKNAAPQGSVSELLTTIEQMQVLLKTGVLPGCFEPSAANALRSGSILWAHVIGRGRKLADMKINAHTILRTDEAGSSCLAVMGLAFGRAPTGRCARLWDVKTSSAPETVANKPGKELADFLSQICTADSLPKGNYPTGYVTKCDRKCLTHALTWDAGASRTLPTQQDRVNGDVLRTVLTYENKTIVLLDRLAWTLVGFARRLSVTQENGSSTLAKIEMDICAASWFKRRPHGSDNFGFGLLNVQLVASFFVTHSRSSLLAAEADLVKGRRRREKEETSPAVSALFRGLICGGDGNTSVTSRFPLAAYVGQIAFFLRVSVEESTKVKFEAVVRAMGGESFSEKKYDGAASWMQTKAAEYVQRFMPGYQYGGEKAPQDQLELFRTMHKAASLISILWLLGTTEPAQATAGSSAKLFFVFLLYSHGIRPDEYYVEKIRRACGKLTVTPRRGFPILEGNPKKRITMKSLLEPLATAVKYAFSDTGNLSHLDNATGDFIEACSREKDEEFDNPAGQQLVIEHQCTILQKAAVSFLAKLFGSGLKKPPPEEEVRKAFQFLENIHEVHSKDDSKQLLQEYKKPEHARQPWNSEGFPTIDCRWKHDKVRQRKMITSATGYSAAQGYELPETTGAEICIAHPLPPLSESEIPYPSASEQDLLRATMGTLV